MGVGSWEEAVLVGSGSGQLAKWLYLGVLGFKSFKLRVSGFQIFRFSGFQSFRVSGFAFQYWKPGPRVALAFRER